MEEDISKSPVLEPKVIVRDGSGHYFIIKEEDQKEFYEWCDRMESEEELNVERFNDCAIGGSLTRLKILAYSIE